MAKEKTFWGNLDIQLSRKHGCFYCNFHHDGFKYRAELQPYVVKNACCVIMKVDSFDNEASVEQTEVYQKGNLPFKPESLAACVKEFVQDITESSHLDICDLLSEGSK